MITLRTFDNAIEAHLWKSALNNAGIPAVVIDENIVTLMPLYNNLVGGIKLCVSEVDSERADLFLREAEDAPVSDDSGQTIACPRCGAASLYFGFKSVRSVKGALAYIISLLFGVYPIYYKSVRRCRACEFEF